MNKNVVYVAVFGVLCVIAGVLVGAGIVKRANKPLPGYERPSFVANTGRFVGYGQRKSIEKRGGGPIEMLTAELGLNAEQKVKVMEILDKTRQQIDKMGEDIRNTITEIREKSDKEIMGILTSQQQEKFKALQKGSERVYRPKLLGGRVLIKGPGLRPEEELPPPHEPQE